MVPGAVLENPFEPKEAREFLAAAGFTDEIEIILARQMPPSFLATASWMFHFDVQNDRSTVKRKMEGDFQTELPFLTEALIPVLETEIKEFQAAQIAELDKDQLEQIALTAANECRTIDLT